MNDRFMRAWTLALTALAFFMVALDTLIVITALPAIQRDLDASLATLAWTVNAFTLAFAGGIITAAALGDRYGRRRIFVIGVTAFGAASAACALAPTATLLITARAVQGAAAAMVMPISLTMLIAAFPKEQRGAIVGAWGGIAGIAVVSGPLIGGAITQGLSWHWIFWVNVPIAAATAMLASVRLRETRGPATRLDPVAVALITVGAVAIVWGLLRAGERGWVGPGAVAALALGVVATAGFFLWEVRADDPMVPLRMFRRSGFLAATVAGFSMAGSSSAATFLMAQYLQTALGLSPFAAGLRLIPWTGGPLVIAPIAGRVSDLIGRRSVLTAGLLVQGIGLGVLATRASSHATYADLLLPLVVGGLGISIAVTIAPAAAVSAVYDDDVGKASGVSGTMQRFGSAFGIAVASAVFARYGGLRSPESVVSGIRPALFVVAGMSVLGAAAALGIGPKQRPVAAGETRRLTDNYGQPNHSVNPAVNGAEESIQRVAEPERGTPTAGLLMTARKNPFGGGSSRRINPTRGDHISGSAAVADTRVAGGGGGDQFFGVFWRNALDRLESYLTSKPKADGESP